MESGPEPTNPLEGYSKAMGDIKSSFTFKKLNMHQLVQIVKAMKSSGSMGIDDINVKMIKQAQTELLPLLLHLINTIIMKTTFPDVLKETKIIPIEKPGKDKNTSEGWRPVNVIAAISKVIERALLKQILNYIETNKLIPPSHHGSIKGKSTQTLATEVHDWLVETMAEEKDAALIILDQSKAYDLVSHVILIHKLEILGFRNQATKIMSSFLSNRKQSVQVEGQ